MLVLTVWCYFSVMILM